MLHQKRHTYTQLVLVKYKYSSDYVVLDVNSETCSMRAVYIHKKNQIYIKYWKNKIDRITLIFD